MRYSETKRPLPLTAARASASARSRSSGWSAPDPVGLAEEAPRARGSRRAPCTRSSQISWSVARSTSQTPTSEAASASSRRQESRDSSASRSRISASLRWRERRRAGAEDRHRRPERPRAPRTPGPQGAGGACQPPFGNRRDLPGAVGQRHPRRHRLLAENRRIAIERRAACGPVAPGQRQVDREAGGVEPGRGVEPVRIDHRRDDPPEPALPGPVRRRRRPASGPGTPGRPGPGRSARPPPSCRGRGPAAPVATWFGWSR